MERLLATDLDGTFIGDDQATLRLWGELDRAGVTVVFVTGRHMEGISDFYAQLGTERRAQACITMMGTEIWHDGPQGYAKDEAWDRLVATGWSHDEVRAVTERCVGLRSQPEEWQSPLKCSFYADADLVDIVRCVEEGFSRAGLDAKVITSGGNLVDVLPRRAGKGAPLRYLAESMGVPLTAVVTAGDTENDLEMLEPGRGFRGIVVSNASARLRALDGPTVYQATAAYAKGVREGLQHFGWI